MKLDDIQIYFIVEGTFQYDETDGDQFQMECRRSRRRRISFPSP